MIDVKMTEEEYQRIRDACRPRPVMVIGNVETSVMARQTILQVWDDIARVHRVQRDTIEPVPGKSDKWFRAEEIR